MQDIGTSPLSSSASAVVPGTLPGARLPEARSADVAVTVLDSVETAEGLAACPSCGETLWQGSAATCRKCGLVFEKWARNEARRRSDAEAAEAAEVVRAPRRVPALLIGLVLVAFGSGAATVAAITTHFAAAPPSLPAVELLAAPGADLEGERFEVVDARGAFGEDPTTMLLAVTLRNVSKATLDGLVVQGQGRSTEHGAFATAPVSYAQVVGPDQHFVVRLSMPADAGLDRLQVLHRVQQLAELPIRIGTRPSTSLE